MSGLLCFSARGVVTAETSVRVVGQGEGDDSILVVYVGDYGSEVALQGDPVDILAFVDRLRDAAIAEAKARWPEPVSA